MNMEQNTRDAGRQTHKQPGRNETIHIRHKHKQDTGDSLVYTYIYTCTCTHINIHGVENIRKKQVRIKGAGVCIETCMYIWTPAEVYVRREVGAYTWISK